MKNLSYVVFPTFSFTTKTEDSFRIRWHHGFKQGIWDRINNK